MGNKKSKNYKTSWRVAGKFENFLLFNEPYIALCSFSPRILFWKSEDYNEEQGERFHQNISEMSLMFWWNRRESVSRKLEC